MVKVSWYRVRAGRVVGVPVIAAAAVVAGAIGLPGFAGGQDGATAVVAVSPSPPVGFSPFEVTVTGQGCDPGAAVAVRVEATRWHWDAATVVEVAEVDVTADGDGTWEAVLPVTGGDALPGVYEVDPGCGARSTYVEVIDPPGFTFGATPVDIVVGQPAVLTLTGAGCPADEAAWMLGPMPSSVAGGSFPVGADGRWGGVVSVTLDDDDLNRVIDGHIALLAACVVDGATVHYEAVLLPVTAAPTTTAPDPDGGPPVTPRFTG